MEKKKIIGFLAFFAVFFLMSCSSDDGSGTSTGGDGGGDGDNLTGDPVQDFPQNFQATGASANDLLSANVYDSLRVEIAYPTGFRPTQETLDNFEQFMFSHTFKTNLEYVFTELPSPNEETLTLQEISDLEIENRTVYSDDNSIGVYIYFTDAPSDTDDDEDGLVTVGAVYRNTSMVIFESTVRSVANSSFGISITDVETATVNHEFGHLFGLVELGSTQVNDHEDPNAPNHCNVEGCLMQAELQLTATFGTFALRGETNQNHLHYACSLSDASVLEMLNSTTASGNFADLDPECVLDLQNNGGR